VVSGTNGQIRGKCFMSVDGDGIISNQLHPHPITVRYRALWCGARGEEVETAFYPSAQEAQDALAKRIGFFEYLDPMRGGAFLPRWEYKDAERNGGLVSVERLVRRRGQRSRALR